MPERKEAIVLCGGQTWMLKAEAQIPKPLLSLGDETLVEKQVGWLADHGFKRVILALSKNLLGYLILKTDVYKKFKNEKTIEILMSIEDTKLGTGGALKKACRFVKSETFYACNVDDLAFEFNPNDLISSAKDMTTVLLAKPTLPYGKVKTRNVYIERFEEKPKLDFYVNAGHYAMKKSIVLTQFPDTGGFEKSVLPKLAKQSALKGFKYHGKWITIDTFNDYIHALGLFEGSHD
ncbi:MAG: NDP-sugar synthase [Candidatus Bathyarchaeota archaeon]|nr:MAG: NDP-sugar synthase [Candidatus Bathyarchaeota archaeon]